MAAALDRDEGGRSSGRCRVSTLAAAVDGTEDPVQHVKSVVDLVIGEFVEERCEP